MSLPTLLRRPKQLIALALAVVLVGGGVAVANTRTATGPSYRTAQAGPAEVDQVLYAVGTIEPVSQASVAFPVAGTVDAVSVAVGDPVTIGERLATLDIGDLEDDLDTAQAALDQAELTLALGLAGEISTASGGAPSGGFGRAADSAGDAELAAAQQAVLDAQQAVDASTIAAQTAIDAAAASCTAPEGDTLDTTSCLAALQAVQTAQAQLAADQAALTQAATALTALLDDRAQTPTTPTTTTTTPTGPQPTIPSGSQPTTPSSGLPSGGGTGATSTSVSPSAEDLIAYQKAVDAAAADVAVAEQAIEQATIVSPIDGRIASVGLAPGDDVTAASATQAIVVVGSGGFEVTTAISVSDLPDIDVGQQVTVTPDGGLAPVAGEVVRIGVAGTASGSTTTYAVTIGLTGDTSALGNGSTASVAITTKASAKSLAVPTSAVSVSGTEATVLVVAPGADEAKETPVEVGAIGAQWTEITDGITEGDLVVLADLGEALPGSATEQQTTATGGTGGAGFFPGGGTGGPPSGFPGARPGG